MAKLPLTPESFLAPPPTDAMRALQGLVQAANEALERHYYRVVQDLLWAGKRAGHRYLIVHDAIRPNFGDSLHTPDARFFSLDIRHAYAGDRDEMLRTVSREFGYGNGPGSVAYFDLEMLDGNEGDHRPEEGTRCGGESGGSGLSGCAVPGECGIP